MPQIKISISDEIYKQLKEDAKEANRSLSNKAGWILSQHYTILKILNTK